MDEYQDKTIEQISEIGESIGYFRLNLPSDFKSYQWGYGEGIYAVCSNEDKEKLDANEDGFQFIAWAANNSVYYPGRIMCGTPILAEARGKKRPVAVWDDLQGTREASENREKILDELFQYPPPDDEGDLEIDGPY